MNSSFSSEMEPSFLPAVGFSLSRRQWSLLSLSLSRRHYQGIIHFHHPYSSSSSSSSGQFSKQHKVDCQGILHFHLRPLLLANSGSSVNIAYFLDTLVHSSNHLATKAMRDGKDHPNFIKSCLAFSEVTIPSIPALTRQLNLYLETAEVALLGGLISHSDGLLDSAVCCLQSIYSIDGLRVPEDVDGVVSLLRKLCSFVLMVPGNLGQRVTYYPSSILSLINSQSWLTPRMRIRALCSIASLSATFAQNEFPYHPMHEEVTGNDRLFFGHPTYSKDLVSLSGVILHNMVKIIPQEPSQAARGNLALEACNCIASFFKVSDEILAICSKLVETAKLCLGPDDKYLRSTINFVYKQSPISPKVGGTINKSHLAAL